MEELCRSQQRENEDLSMHRCLSITRRRTNLSLLTREFQRCSSGPDQRRDGVFVAVTLNCLADIYWIPKMISWLLQNTRTSGTLLSTPMRTHIFQQRSTWFPTRAASVQRHFSQRYSHLILGLDLCAATLRRGLQSCGSDHEMQIQDPESGGCCL